MKKDHDSWINLRMKKDLDSWVNLPPHSMWQFGGLNSQTDLQKPDMRQHITPLRVFPSNINVCGCSFSGNASILFPENRACKSSEIIPTLKPLAIPTFSPPEYVGSQKGLPVFDHSWERTGLIFSSSCNPCLTLNPTNPSLDLQGSNDVVSIRHGGEEMHEDTDEIDALLYSDSRDDDSREEEASTGHSPIEPMTGSSSEVASSIVPVKRKRVDVDEPDSLLVDTASSEASHHHNYNLDFRNEDSNKDGESSYVKGEDQECKRVKRERILETVGVLRRIIPGAKGKDAATVLDEAIGYLKSFKPKAKALGATAL